MSQYRTLNRKILAKVETTSGTDANPVVGTDALACIDPQMPGGPATIANDNEVTGSLDVGAPIVGGGGAGFTCSARLKGSGTGATAPELAALLRGCGLQQGGLGTTHSGSATAGSSTSITLAAGASAVNDAYVGMVLRTTSGTGSGQARVVSAYNGTTKVASVHPDFSPAPAASTGYSIDANTVFTPRSSGLETLSIYDYVIRNAGNVRLRKVLGAAGTMSLTLPVRDLPTARFQFQGKFVTPTDVADPGAVTLQSTTPLPIVSTNCFLGTGTTVTRFNTLELDLGNNVQNADDPSDPFGIDVAAIVRRSITGRISPPLDLLSVRDVWAAFLAGTEFRLWVSWGSVAGNRVSIYVPRLRYTGREDQDINGFMHESIPFAVLGGSMFLAFW